MNRQIGDDDDGDHDDNADDDGDDGYNHDLHLHFNQQTSKLRTQKGGGISNVLK